MLKNQTFRNLVRMALLAAAVWILSAPRGQADMVIGIQQVNALPGSTGDTLQVTLTNTGASSVTVAGFSFGLNSTSPNLTFTAVDDSTVDTYIFANHSLFGPDISVQPPNLPGQTLEAEDNYDTPNSGVAVAAGATVGLGDVFFNISPGTPFGLIPVNLIPLDDSLSDAGGNPIAVSGTGGNVAVVPEPALGGLAGIALLAMLGRRKRITDNR